ncbi:hypothetical protein [Parvibaculum sp.]|jgi:hypothetical protein|uniref:hypothetical protein n=1 Tax=Parvibaculum sp. TaxID=2024848 RepID=UPI0027328C32|nr:hypothetical protein [Parvibaculum sp.]MDP3327220.1 hypothetical protein [Parvibaculum sp.]
MTISPKPMMPRDSYNAPIPALRARNGGAKKGTAGSSSTRIGPFESGTAVISIYAPADIRYEVGGDSIVAVLATSHLLAAGERLVVALRPTDTHIAIIRVGDADVAVDVSELE